MTPRTRPPYQWPLLLSPDDVKALRDASVSLGQIATMMAEVKEMTVDNHHTLRGHNGDAGMVAQFSTMEHRLNDAITSLEALKDVPTKLETLKGQVDALKDVPVVIDTWKRYPSLTWMIRHKFKEMAIMTATATALTILVGFPDYYVGQRVQAVLELLITKWLRL